MYIYIYIYTHMYMCSYLHTQYPLAASEGPPDSLGLSAPQQTYHIDYVILV